MIPIKNEMVWRPRMHKQSVSINQEGRFFAVTCRSLREADIVMKALIRAFVRARKPKNPFTKIVPVIKEKP